MGEFNPQCLADILGGMEALGRVPPLGWQKAWVVAVQRNWGKFDSAQLVKVLWAAASLKVDISKIWLVPAIAEVQEVLLQGLREGVEGEPPVHVWRLVWALGFMRVGIPQGLADALGVFACKGVVRMEVRQLRRCALSLGKLRPPPKQHVLEYFVELGEARLKGLRGERGELLGTALGVLREDVGKWYGGRGSVATRSPAAGGGGARGFGGGYGEVSGQGSDKEMRGDAEGTLDCKEGAELAVVTSAGFRC